MRESEREWGTNVMPVTAVLASDGFVVADGFDGFDGVDGVDGVDDDGFDDVDGFGGWGDSSEMENLEK